MIMSLTDFSRQLPQLWKHQPDVICLIMPLSTRQSIQYLVATLLWSHSLPTESHHCCFLLLREKQRWGGLISLEGLPPCSVVCRWLSASHQGSSRLLSSFLHIFGMRWLTSLWVSHSCRPVAASTGRDLASSQSYHDQSSHRIDSTWLCQSSCWPGSNLGRSPLSPR